MSSMPLELPDLLLCGGCGDRPKKGETFKTCSGCSFVAYCSAACQLAAWPDHKGPCKEKKKAKAKSKAAAKSPVSGSGGVFEDMGSLLVALNMRQPQPPQTPQPLHPPHPQPSPPPPPHYWEGSAYNACLLGQHEELKTILRQDGITVNWAEPTSGATAAYIAAQQGHVQCLSLLAEHGLVDLSKALKDGFAPIHIACQLGRYVCLKVLLDYHVDANLRVADVGGSTPTIIACQCGRVKLLALLLDRGADPNLSSSIGNTAAYSAVQCGHAECLSLLAQCGSVDLSKASKEGAAPIHAAFEKDRYACLEILLDNHVDVNIRVADKHGYTPAIIACQYGRVKLLALLLDKGSDPNMSDSEGSTAAYYAAQNGHAECLSLLAQHGSADLSKASKEGAAPIHIACQDDRYTCVKVLLDNHVDVNLRVADKERGDTPAMIACQSGHVKVLALLLDKGSDPNMSNNEGSTAAYMAAQFGHAECLSLLAQYGSADLSKASKDGFAPIHIACERGRYTCVKVLLDNHVDVNLRVVDVHGRTPTMLACQYDHVKLLALLLDRGADPNLSDSVGNTAAHRACQGGHLKSLQLLRERNADLNVPNSHGYTPLDFARMCKQPECVDLLLACGYIGRNKEDLPAIMSEALIKKRVHDLAEETKDIQREARRCDLPSCQASAADLELGERFKKCPACRVTIYCCKIHAMRHMSEHHSLCEELTRVCDFPKCRKHADIDIKCRRCKVATYCCKNHRSKHSSAHESRCDELCEWR